jgi:transposase
MGKAYSVDLRERVVRAVEEKGMSRRKAARRRTLASATAPRSRGWRGIAGPAAWRRNAMG